jgi:Lon protease-like protein
MDVAVSAELVPIFPLDLVLMPGAPQQLHIFEPRYRRMLADAQAEARAAGDVRPAIGIVALNSGGETSLDQSVADVGTMGEIVQAQRHPDGTSDLLLVGGDRFRIVEVDTARPYLRAQVVWLDEEDGASEPELAQLQIMARELYRRYTAALGQVSGRVSDEGGIAADDVISLSFEISARIQLETTARQQLLSAPDAAQRLLRCMELLHRELTLLEKTRTVPISANALRIVATPN